MVNSAFENNVTLVNVKHLWYTVSDVKYSIQSSLQKNIYFQNTYTHMEYEIITLSHT